MHRLTIQRKSTLTGVLFSLFLGCSEDSAEDKEQAVLSQAIVETETQSQEIEEKPQVQSDVPISVVFDFENMSRLMQSYFGDETAVRTLSDALRYDSNPLTSPVLVRVRWIPEDGTRGVGEVGLVYDRPMGSFDEAQTVANALIQYRNYVGGAFDLRLLSFDLYLEGQGQKGCRVEILNPIGMTKPVISPCLTLNGQKICAKDDGQWTPELQAGMPKCFIP
jgi:hypothetical protein